jgi:hypothetical protein
MRREADGRPRGKDDAGDRSHEQTSEHPQVNVPEDGMPRRRDRGDGQCVGDVGRHQAI